MTFSASELSIQDGAPIECFDFARGPITWRYTSADADLTVDLRDWESVPISRSAIEASQESARNAITVTVARDNPLADLYRVSPPSDVITLTLYRYHATDADAELVTLWMGRIVNVAWRGLTAEIRCEPVYTSLKRPGLRRLYQRSCPHVLYGADCAADPGAVRVVSTVEGIAGNVLTIPGAASQPDNTYSGGYVEWEGATGVFERRMIITQIGAACTVTTAIMGLALHAEVRLYPGCDKTLATCDARFGNRINYGGFPWIPTKNPFGGDPIF